MPSFSADDLAPDDFAPEDATARPLRQTPEAERDALAGFPSEVRGLRAMIRAQRLRPRRGSLLLPAAGAIAAGILLGILWVAFGARGAGGHDRPAVVPPAGSTPVPAAEPAPSTAVPPTTPEVPPASSPSTIAPARGPRDSLRPTATSGGRPASPATGERPAAVREKGNAGPSAAKPKETAAGKPADVEEVVYADFLPPAPPPAPESADRIYSAEDADVQPPVAARAWFSTSPPVDLSRAEVNEVEILVSARGDVMSARMLAGPRSYTSGMTLSAIKATTFRAALKNGRPVAYRLVVWVKAPAAPPVAPR